MYKQTVWRNAAFITLKLSVRIDNSAFKDSKYFAG